MVLNFKLFCYENAYFILFWYLIDFNNIYFVFIIFIVARRIVGVVIEALDLLQISFFHIEITFNKIKEDIWCILLDVPVFGRMSLETSAVCLGNDRVASSFKLISYHHQS